jgi:hypothetical protein
MFVRCYCDNYRNNIIFTYLKINLNYEGIMGKMKGGNITGMVGNIVFTNYNGETYVRTAPKKRAKNGWSDRQVMNRNRFRTLSAFWMKFKNTPVGQIWRMAEEGKRGNILFIKANIQAFGTDGVLTDPERLHFSAGKLPLPQKFTAGKSGSTPGEILVNWQNDPGSGLASDGDQLMMMIADNGDFIGPIAAGAARKQQSAVIALPADHELASAIYLFFGSDKRKLYSPDQYFGLE